MVDHLETSSTEPSDANLALDVRFLEQEHRILSIIRNLRRHKEGERRAAASRSFRGWLLSVFFSGTIAAGSVGVLLTIFTLSEMRKQTGEMAGQTKEMARQTLAVTLQNKQIADQILIEGEQSYQTGRAQLLSIIFDAERAWPWMAEGLRSSSRARTEAIVSFALLEIEHQRRRGLEPLVDLKGAAVPREAFLKLKARGSDLTLLQLEGAVLTGETLSGLDLTGARLAKAKLDGAILLDTNLTDAMLSEAELRHGDLMSARLVRANLEWAVLSDSHLANAVFVDADMIGADLRNAKLQGADLRGADLRKASFDGATLTGAWWNQQPIAAPNASPSRTTLWPRGFDPLDAKHGLKLMEK